MAQWSRSHAGRVTRGLWPGVTAALFLCVAQVPGWCGTTERISVTPGGVQGNGSSGQAIRVAMSADGRYIAFASAATNLILLDGNGHADVFVRDRLTGGIERVSVSTSGYEGNGDSGTANAGNLAISPDGRYVAFGSYATNFVSGTPSGKTQVFVRDRLLGTTVCASVTPGGTPGDGYSANPSLSADGRYVAFESMATNLLATATGGIKVYIRDLVAGVTTCASLNASGNLAHGVQPAITPDGRYVAFASTNIYVRDRLAGTTEQVSLASDGSQPVYPPR